MWDDSDFWVRWQRHYTAFGIDGYCFDGAPDAYWTTSPRILFVLKEPNKAGGQDMRAQLRKGPEKPIWHAFGRWAVGLLEHFPDYGAIPKQRMRTAMSRVAAINIKKETGGASASSIRIHAAAHRDRHLLSEQITALAPDLIVACGTFEPLLWVLDLNLRPEHLKMQLIPDAGIDFSVLRWRHPARATRDHYEQLRTAVVGVSSTYGAT